MAWFILCPFLPLPPHLLAPSCPSSTSWRSLSLCALHGARPLKPAQLSVPFLRRLHCPRYLSSACSLLNSKGSTFICTYPHLCHHCHALLPVPDSCHSVPAPLGMLTWLSCCSVNWSDSVVWKDTGPSMVHMASTAGLAGRTLYERHGQGLHPALYRRCCFLHLSGG